MNLDSSIWFDRNRRREQLDEHIIHAGKARFGSEELDESQKAERVRRHFNSVAAKYDMMNTLLSMGIHYLWKYQGIQMIGLKPGDKVLDVCGGTGDLSILADKKTGPSGKVILYDINWEMMKAGREKSSSAFHRKRIAYVQGDAEQICFPDNTFDAVMVGFAIRNITHMKQAFREMHRVLKPGGRFLCLEFSKPIWPWFRFLYDFYSFHIMPFLGELIVGSKTAYTCLPETIRLFLLPDELSEVFRETGFSEVNFSLLTNGIAVAHTGRKP
ncbi:MAG: bifunctional demethylmenaquinone methyltransferase/2-methoxy-6-polyprenyl-1,4-benzoquinol methylase UbiE [Desulfobacterales bacterium]